MQFYILLINLIFNRRVLRAGWCRLPAVVRLLCVMLCALALAFVASVVPQHSLAQQQESPVLTVQNDGSGKLVEGGWALDFGLPKLHDWPQAFHYGFSISRPDKKPFQGLSAPDVAVWLDNQKLSDPGEIDLQVTGGEARSVLLLIDGSGSMTEINKLVAAKQALEAFVKNLEPQDIAAIYAFNKGFFPVVTPTTDKTELLTAISVYRIRRDSNSTQTYMYDAIDKGLNTAAKTGLRNLVVISDGMDNSPGTDKQWQEQSIVERAQKAGISIFTVAIGDDRPGSLYVDRQSLSNISEGTVGQPADFIDLPKLQEDAVDDQEYTKLLVDELKKTLELFRERIKYDYSLTISPPGGFKRDGVEHFIKIECIVGRNKENAYKLTRTLKINWSPDKPVFVDPGIDRPAELIFFNTGPLDLTKIYSMTKIYLSLLTILTIAALGPVAARRLGEGKDVRLTRKAIIEVKANSPYIGRECPNEGDALGSEHFIRAGDVIVVCPNSNCQTPHHLDCWHLTNGHCWRFACKHYMALPEQVLSKYGLEIRPNG